MHMSDRCQAQGHRKSWDRVLFPNSTPGLAVPALQGARKAQARSLLPRLQGTERATEAVKGLA